ncbi:hypothetical protein PpBr36_08258 [Pyricularia pennisetigena]|uniref:hypothetical protein n=1 Tax=Pyricularia pennisetigena TaxID=1578925 RepID=UPI00114F3A0F|nr:hypothetical protein PpBr36_08258 [Pyricularia pennisetigena]TLS24539.1 hypothetical protein PpBr36_08258 [Pyricularia pennisetigena]
MPVLRRYRVFVVGAVILLILLFRVAENSQWELEAANAAVYDSAHKGTKNSRPTYEKPVAPAKAHDDQGPDAAPRRQKIDIPQLKGDPTRSKIPAATRQAAGGADIPKDTHEPSTTPKPVGINMPDRDPDQRPLAHDRFPPANKQGSSSATATTSKLHWVKKAQEDYPIPEDQIIPLPTGKPKAIPTIQHRFGKETAAAKKKREARLAQIKKETKRAWNSYKKYAWGHDEVEPISLEPRDPFCGWAATLVDSLDTLWIMGLKDEFEDAYKALDDIDFTTTERSEIPVFETIIRYMGGLLAAYDISGGKEGKHPKLLTKVEELAEVLMSIFDTPNRMPILYYRWQPQYADQRLRASNMVSVAELGSMSMEFTRLAQLTGNNRYYDAIARITDAFDEWQKRGTALDGIFPQQIDASGCNRTVEPVTSSAEESELGTPAIGPPEAPRGNALVEENELRKLRARAVTKGRSGTASSAADSATSDNGKDTEIPSIPKPRANTYNRDSTDNGFRGTPPPDGCRPQGLVESSSGWGSYSMGGSQDSAYEYFPKQYILLGGLVEQYKKLHENAVAAIKKHLLYRPMTKQEDRSLLFSAAVNARGYGKDMSLTYQYEVTHLTCFLGGMFAMGGKIFQSEEDVAIGAQLADGCVWAYESTASGIMPENSHVVPCQSVEKCPWNETLWYEHLDPNSDWRNDQVADYKVKKKEWDQMVADTEKKIKNKADADWEAKKARVAGKPLSTPGSKTGKSDVGGGSKMPSPGFSVLDGAGPGVKPGAKRSLDDTERVASAKRSITYDTESKGSAKDGEMEAHKRKRSVDDTETGSWSANKANARRYGRAHEPNPAMAGAEDAIGGLRGSISLSEALSPDSPTYNPLWDLPPEPSKPQSHKEFVEEKIEGGRIPPGFVDIIDNRYILR